MRADLSRDTFDATNGYHAVILEMGRVLLDADFNEQGALTGYLARQANLDTVGHDGVPRDGGGFAIASTADGGDLSISVGRMYADGLQVDNAPQVTTALVTSGTGLRLATTTLDEWPLGVGDQIVVPGSSSDFTIASISGTDVEFTAPHGLTLGFTPDVRRAVSVKSQPFAFRESPVVDGSALVAGRYIAVLRACLRDETAIDKPGIAEVALGGPDSSTRLRMIWQVLLSRVGDVGSGSCTDWQPPTRTGTLQPSLSTPGSGSGDCALPPDAAYRGAEHHLFRVEVNGVDDSGNITSLLYDRDNASVASLITNLGQTVTLESFGTRGAGVVGGFDNAQTVTVTDRHREWDGAPAQVVTTSNANPAKLTLDLSASPTCDSDARPRLRRWSAELGPVTSGQVLTLEDGLSVVVTGRPRVGDYWLIPARSAFGGSGTLDWPTDDSATFRALPAHGPDESWTPLALVDFDGTTFTSVADCRAVFPALTAITAGDVSYDDSRFDLGAPTVQAAIEALYQRGGGGCTLTLEPQPGWEAAFAQIPDGLDARICFRAGEYPTSGRVTLSNKGSVILQGIGPATRVHATADEVAISIENCRSVSVRDMAFVAEAGDRPAGGGLLGALTIIGAVDVDVSNVVAASSTAPDVRSTCVTIAGPDPADPSAKVNDGPETLGRQSPTRVIVRDCTLSPGEYQIGLMVRNFDRCDVSDTVIQGPVTSVFGSVDLLPKILQTKMQVAMIKDLALTQQLTAAAPGGGAEGAAPGAAHATIATRQLVPIARTIGTVKQISSGSFTFQTAGRVAEQWRSILTANPLTAATVPLARAQLSGLIASAFTAKPPPEVLGLRGVLDGILVQRVPVISQGIVVGGVHASEVRISGCTIVHAIKGIEVAASNRVSLRGGRVKIRRVAITGNEIGVSVPPEAGGGRHGIYIGHSDSVLVAENVLAFSSQAVQDKIQSSAIRLGGFFGTDLVIRDNHTSSFPTGVWIRSNFDPAIIPTLTRWAVRGNLFESVAKDVQVDYIGYTTLVTQPPIRRADNVPLP